MDKEAKKIVRLQFARELIENDFSQDQLTQYLKTDLSLSPKEWLNTNGGATDKEVEEYLDERFPETEKKK